MRKKEIKSAEIRQYAHFEDFEEFYGPDAYLIEPYPVTPIGNQVMEVPLSASAEAEVNQERLASKKKTRFNPSPIFKREFVLKK
jgi:hypothetical protein